MKAQGRRDSQSLGWLRTCATGLVKRLTSGIDSELPLDGRLVKCRGLFEKFEEESGRFIRSDLVS